MKFIVETASIESEKIIEYAEHIKKKYKVVKNTIDYDNTDDKSEYANSYAELLVKIPDLYSFIVYVQDMKTSKNPESRTGVVVYPPGKDEKYATLVIYDDHLE